MTEKTQRTIELEIIRSELQAIGNDIIAAEPMSAIRRIDRLLGWIDNGAEAVEQSTPLPPIPPEPNRGPKRAPKCFKPIRTRAFNCLRYQGRPDTQGR